MGDDIEIWGSIENGGADEDLLDRRGKSKKLENRQKPFCRGGGVVLALTLKRKN